MGGGGSIDAMIKSYNFNKGQIKKHKKSYYKIAQLYSYKGRPIILKKATKEEIKYIRAIYKKKRKKLFIIKIITILVIAALSIISLFLILKK